MSLVGKVGKKFAVEDLAILWYHDGDKVFVEKCDSVEIGEIGIFIVNGEAYIKELGNRCLISHNSAYKPIKLGSSDSVYCCGRVLGVVEE